MDVEMRGSYGLTVGAAVTNMLIVAGALTGGGFFLRSVLLGIPPWHWQLILDLLFFVPSGLLALMAAHMVYSDFYVKYDVAARILRSVRWTGDEMVLDVGTGTGMFLCAMGLAIKKRGGVGRGFGVDLFQKGRRASLSAATVMSNAREEEVHRIVDAKRGDVFDLPFGDDSFDVITVCMTLGFLEPVASDRNKERALREIYRVMKPGGVLIVWDGPCEIAQRTLASLGCKVDVTKNIAAYAGRTEIIRAVKQGSNPNWPTEKGAKAQQ